MGTKQPKQKPKSPAIGLRQAHRLCQLPHRDRLSFLAEGLPIVLESAKGFWAAAEKLKDHPRERAVLENFAEEEAAKILIVMDIVRCPPKLIASKIDKLISWFYNHLARLIYAEALRWKPMHLSQLRGYVNQKRRGHFLEGWAGEYILPNWAVYERESKLYADIEAYESGSLGWNVPHAPFREDYSFLDFPPLALQLADAMQHLGLFTADGLHTTSEIWGKLEYRDEENHADAEKLTEALLNKLHIKKLIVDSANDNHVAAIYQHWQIPMYNLDLSLIPVTLEELKAEQEAEYLSAVGHRY